MKQFPWHVLVFAIYPILYLLTANLQYVEMDEIYLPILISIGGTGLILLLSRPITGSWLKAGLLTSLVVVLFYNYGLYQNSCKGIVLPLWFNGVRMDHNFYKYSSLILLVLVVWRMRKAKGKLIKLTSTVNLVALVLLGMTLFNLVSFQIKNSAEEVELPDDDLPSVPLAEVRPTIYYLIMDAYTRSDILQEYFDFDNSEFLNFLRDEGFYVADSAISNYGQTVLSIPSSMNMQYMDSVISVLGEKNGDRWPMFKVLNNSKVLKMLKRQQYKSMAFDASMFEVVYLSKADEFHETAGTKLSLFHNLLINSTAIRAFNRRKNINTLSQEDFHRKKILEAFNMMEKIPQKKQPYYVHGHVLAPHQPFLFLKDGSPRDMGPDYGYNIWSPMVPGQHKGWYIDGYTQQLQFVNSKLIHLIKKIKSDSKRPYVIIIQGDHGTASELRNHEGFKNNDFRERFSILNAYYFHDQDYSKLYPGISPVNSFKVVMNKYFGTKYQLEEDRAYFSDWTHPYELYDVTDSIR
ncbi:MAG: hypothetical protein KDC76_01070 [Bacteroidetes bacterium]|nr:hypothetical protein [Bacteroidota bacterium]